MMVLKCLLNVVLLLVLLQDCFGSKGETNSGCPSGWDSAGIGGRDLCFKYFSEKLDYRTAKRKCRLLEGNTHLAMPKDEETNSAVTKYKPKKLFWIGLDDWQHKDEFVWADGTYLADSFSGFTAGFGRPVREVLGEDDGSIEGEVLMEEEDGSIAGEVLGEDDWSLAGDVLMEEEDGSREGEVLMEEDDGSREGEVLPSASGNKSGRAHCVTLKNGIWEVKSCNIKKPYLCQLEMKTAHQCTDTGVVDWDDHRLSCPDYISKYGNFMCDESLVYRLCCQTCKSLLSLPVEVKYPGKYRLDVLFTIEKSFQDTFKSWQIYPMSKVYLEFLQRETANKRLFEPMKESFDRDLNLTMNFLPIWFPDYDFNSTYEDGGWSRSQSIMFRYGKVLKEQGFYKKLRYDLAVVITGRQFFNGRGNDPGLWGPAGMAKASSVCSPTGTSVIQGIARKPASHEIGHQLSLGHGSGGVMYGTSTPGTSFQPNQKEKIHKFLRKKWTADSVSLPARKFPAKAGDIQRSYIGSNNCLRDSTPDVANLNLELPVSEKSPDKLCRNLYGQNSSFCHYSAYYGDKMATGDAICSNLHCVVGSRHSECYPLKEVIKSTEGMSCSLNGKTCHDGKCVSSGASSACPSGQYGEFCEKQCHCADHSEVCDDVTGACTSGCHTDFTGADCQTPNCPPDWIPLAASGKCYKNIGKLTYLQAQAKCDGLKGKTSLPLVKSPEVHDFIKKIMGEDISTWMGLDDLDGDKVWRWDDGTYPIWAKWETKLGKHWHRGLAGRCTAHSNTTWDTVTCKRKRNTLCEMDIARYSERTNSFCPNGEQSYVTLEKLGQSITCSDVIKNYGPAACAGNYPVVGMRDVCCETCKGLLAPASSESSSSKTCLHQEEGFFLQSDGTKMTCGQYLDSAPEGNQACAEYDFWTFCCKTCSQRFSTRIQRLTDPCMNQGYCTPKGGKEIFCRGRDNKKSCQRFCGFCKPTVSEEICHFGSVNRIMLQGDSQGQTCSELMSQQGPGVCAVTQGSSQSVSKQCCKECNAKVKPSGDCLYDDGKVVNRDGTYVSCAEYMYQYGYTECDGEEVSQVCCKTCSQYAKKMTEKCPSDWLYGFTINKCYYTKTGKQMKANIASNYCQQLGGYLPRARSPKEYSFIAKKTYKTTWLDLYTKLVGDKFEWRWGDGQPLAWADWIKEEDVPQEVRMCAYTNTAGFGRTDCTGNQTRSVACFRDLDH